MQLVEYLEKTTQSAFGERCGVSQSAVSQWLKNGVPFDKVRVVFGASDGKVTPHDCFPDIFPAGFVFPPEPVPVTNNSMLGAFFARLSPLDRAAFAREVEEASKAGARGDDWVAAMHAIAVRLGATFSLDELFAERQAGLWMAAAERAALTFLPVELRLLPGPREVHDRQFVKSRSKDFGPGPIGPDPLDSEAAA